MDMGGSLLDAGRRINRSGIGLSANSRAVLESFFDGGISLFNQLYNKAENGEASNTATILALRSKYSYLVNPDIQAETPEPTAGSTFFASNLDSDTQTQIKLLQSRYGAGGVSLPTTLSGNDQAAAAAGTTVDTTA